MVLFCVLIRLSALSVCISAQHDPGHHRGKMALRHINKNGPCNRYTEVFSSVKIENFIRKINIFLIFAQNINCGYTFEPPRQGGSNKYPNSFLAKIR